MTQALNLANLANYINSSGKLDASQALTGTVTSTGLNISNDASISGLTVGKGGGGSSLNTVVGYQAASTATGTALTAIGYQAGYANTENTFGTTFVGYQAGYGNTTGVNTAVGSLALKTNTTGSNNVAIGGQSMQANTTGSSNSALGNNSLVANTTGSYNTATGQAALASNTTASNNTAVGYQAGYSNTTGTQNTFIGTSAGYSNTAYGQHTVIGFQAGYYNVNGNINTFLGWQAGFNSNPSVANTNSLNCFLGYYAGWGVTTGVQNTFVGGNASGYLITTGSNHTIIGNYNGNQGGLDIRTNTTGFVVLSTGTGAVMAYSANGSGWYQQNNSSAWATTSDQRLKKNIVDNTVGLDAITKIQVRNFEYRTADEVTDLPKEQAIDIKGVQLGAIAQELIEVLPDCVKTESTGVMSVDASNITWHLINAVKELNAKITALENK